MATILIIGGSGFVSGTIARLAQARGDGVYVVTRGNKPVPTGVTALRADRNDGAAFAAAVSGAEVPGKFDLVVDCIGFEAKHAVQDLGIFFPEGGAARAGHLVFLSSDFVCSTVDRPFFIDETFDHFDTAPYGKGKRAAEVVLLEGAGKRGLPITVFRPCHIYGPGSLLGCLPLHGRDPQLLTRIRAGEGLKLLGAGHYLQQPIFVEDLAALVLACPGLAGTRGELFFAAGPEIIESRRFYQIIGELIGVPAVIEEASITEYLKGQPEHRAFCAHRLYRMEKAKEAGLPLPTVGVREGLARHLASLK